MPENPRLEELRRRVQADPASIAFAALAEEFRRTGRFEDAIQTCRTGLQRHPAYLSARVTLGRALIEIGDYDAAREELETVLRSAPENLAAIRGLEQIHERLGHSTEMHPDLHEMVREPIRLAAEKPVQVFVPTAPPPPPEPPPPAPPAAASPALDLSLASAPPPAPSPVSLDSFDLSLSTPEPPTLPLAGEAEAARPDEPFDIFAAALAKPVAAPEPPPVIPFEPGTIAFEAPAFVPAPAASDVSVDETTFALPAPEASMDTSTPDPHVAALLTRLEQFLGAIETARHA